MNRLSDARFTDQKPNVVHAVKTDQVLVDGVYLKPGQTTGWHKSPDADTTTEPFKAAPASGGGRRLAGRSECPGNPNAADLAAVNACADQAAECASHEPRIGRGTCLYLSVHRSRHASNEQCMLGAPRGGGRGKSTSGAGVLARPRVGVS